MNGANLFRMTGMIFITQFGKNGSEHFFDFYCALFLTLSKNLTLKCRIVHTRSIQTLHLRRVQRPNEPIFVELLSATGVLDSHVSHRQG